jgi:hypothetical protein
MRVKSHIWVSAYLRRLDAALIPAAVVRRGDADAGAIYIKLSTLDGYSQILAPVPAYMLDTSDAKRDGFLMEDGRAWQPIYKSHMGEVDADSYLSRQASMDPDMWIIDVETRSGRHLIGIGEQAGPQSLALEREFAP